MTSAAHARPSTSSFNPSTATSLLAGVRRQPRADRLEARRTTDSEHLSVGIEAPHPVFGARPVEPLLPLEPAPTPARPTGEPAGGRAHRRISRRRSSRRVCTGRAAAPGPQEPKARPNRPDSSEAAGPQQGKADALEVQCHGDQSSGREECSVWRTGPPDIRRAEPVRRRQLRMVTGRAIVLFGPCLVRREIISLKDSVPHRLPNPSVLAFSGLAMMGSWPQLLAVAQARPD